MFGPGQSAAIVRCRSNLTPPIHAVKTNSTIVESCVLWHLGVAVKIYSHPAMRDIQLPAIMQALSDPCRLAIVRELLQARSRALACHEVRLDISKATRSHHFEVLRAAGII